MLRKFHSWSGLMVMLLVVVLSVTGAVLSVNSVFDFVQAKVVDTSSISVAELTGKLAFSHPNVEQIQRSPSGSIIVYYTKDGQTKADLINPRTGETIEAYLNSPVMVWVKNLHRSYLLGTPGRVGVGFTTFFMLLLSILGVFMLAKRLGGWHQILQPIQGDFRQRLHCQVGRVAVLALMLSAITGLYMSAVTFELLPHYQSSEPAFPEGVNGGVPASINTLAALKSIPLSELRELVYPYKDDHDDVYSITTHQGNGFIDQSTGQLLSFQPFNNKKKLYEFIYMLHTGEELWWLGLLLALGALTVPLMSWTGMKIWWSRRSTVMFNNNNVPRNADTLLLVGSEGNSTWGFAKTFHDALNLAGYQVHTISMNNFMKNSVSRYPKTKRLFILTATYGDGDAPASASKFLAKLDKTTEVPEFSFAVLGFGDRQFPNFCQYAKDVEAALTAKGWSQLLPFGTVNRQSSQEFSRWGNIVGRVINAELSLVHNPNHPCRMTLGLIERVDYGAKVQAPTVVLRFKQANIENKGLPYFEAGDLVGILAPGSKVARFYSLASASKDGMLEICIRHHFGGLCSSFLHSLSVGDSVEAFIQPNPSFRPALGKAPIVLIGAGTGIGPLVGFIRHNKTHNPIHLYWGGRSPQSDFLYESELKAYLKDKRLTELNAVFSRTPESSYVQEKIIVDSLALRRLIEKGAQVLVCGGRNMANSVMVALDEVIAPLGMDVLTLKAQGRYREDVY